GEEDHTACGGRRGSGDPGAARPPQARHSRRGRRRRGLGFRRGGPRLHARHRRLRGPRRQLHPRVRPPGRQPAQAERAPGPREAAGRRPHAPRARHPVLLLQRAQGRREGLRARRQLLRHQTGQLREVLGGDAVPRVVLAQLQRVAV
ncbi:MAG: hypothetical protein AVDCRST_MAG12-3603, partial [uncultured Rubrobacteraceae bacterium]